MPSFKNILRSLKLGLFLALVLFLPVLNAQQYLIKESQNPSEKVIRAAIDIGSGATKLRVAEVNLKTHKIERILVNESFTVQYQEQLAKSPNNTFDEEVMKTGIEAIRKSAEIAKNHQAQKVIAVATASFRKAANSLDLIDKIYTETGVRVYVIDQDLEGKLAFNAVLSQGNYNPKDLVVWDIGGGSLQLTSMDEQGGYKIYRGEIASIHFKNMMIQEIQKKSIHQVTTPNPIATHEIHKGIDKSKEIAENVDKIFKERMQKPNTQVVGVGNIFAYGIYPAVGKKSPFKQQELTQALFNMANKDDLQVGGGDYANVQVSNTILILGYMRALNLHQMDVLDVNNADGAMLYPEFWAAN
ncbi:MAG: hypothetical protein BGO14_11140 [Chlamydiales bacterium 38-26]|nr:hypothetical protein [Chlamydiales bacterium]OJV11505.1 MAG: hypothetical protein BGO14_11140 [Chlamydiales bacterium 38-26]